MSDNADQIVSNNFNEYNICEIDGVSFNTAVIEYSAYSTFEDFRDLSCREERIEFIKTNLKWLKAEKKFIEDTFDKNGCQEASLVNRYDGDSCLEEIYEEYLKNLKKEREEDVIIDNVKFCAKWINTYSIGSELAIKKLLSLNTESERKSFCKKFSETKTSKIMKLELEINKLELDVLTKKLEICQLEDMIDKTMYECDGEKTILRINCDNSNATNISYEKIEAIDEEIYIINYKIRKIKEKIKILNIKSQVYDHYNHDNILGTRHKYIEINDNFIDSVRIPHYLLKDNGEHVMAKLLKLSDEKERIEECEKIIKYNNKYNANAYYDNNFALCYYYLDHIKK